MRILVLACALCTSWLAAQQEPAPSSKPEPTAAERLQQLEAQLERMWQTWREAVLAARDAAEKAEPGAAVPAMPMRPDMGPIVRQAQACAQQFAGSDDAARFLVIVLHNAAEASTRAAAFEVLMRDHLDSEVLAELGELFVYLEGICGAETAAKAMARLPASNHPKVRGWASFAQHKPTIEKAARDGDDYGAARKALLAVADTAADEQLASEIRATIDLRERFGPGNVAPDIAGIDLDGVAFRLTDYRGKVLFLDFWGDW